MTKLDFIKKPTSPMSPKAFQELLQSIRQAGKIRRGEMPASRRIVVEVKKDGK